MTLAVLERIVQVFYKVFFSLGLSDISLMIRLGLCVWETISEVIYISHGTCEGVLGINMTYHQEY